MPSLLRLISVLLWMGALGGLVAGAAAADPASALGALVGLGGLAYAVGIAASKEEAREQDALAIQRSIANRLAANSEPNRSVRSSGGNSGTKRCPDCAEDVRAQARKCRFCGYQFDESTIPPEPEHVTAPQGEIPPPVPATPGPEATPFTCPSCGAFTSGVRVCWRCGRRRPDA